MTSLFDELSAKVDADRGPSRRSLPRFDLTLLLFNSRGDIRDLWVAADEQRSRAEAEGFEVSELAAALDRLRPVFGDREPS